MKEQTHYFQGRPMWMGDPCGYCGRPVEDEDAIVGEYQDPKTREMKVVLLHSRKPESEEVIRSQEGKPFVNQFVRVEGNCDLEFMMREKVCIITNKVRLTERPKK